jgi:phenylpropionate dioxygenase-like ring-hydroxylating dioxygenase large terminal subunit
VQGGRLQCPYHGRTFDLCGHGQSPGTPRLQAQVASYEAREAYGAIWVKPQAAVSPFPEFAVDGYRHMCTLRHPMQAPLELALDNFSEIEHTAIVHQAFGFDPARMAEVNVHIDSTDTTVHVRNVVSPETPCERLREFRERLRTWLKEQSLVVQDKVDVHIHQITSEGVELSLSLFLTAVPAAEETSFREAIHFEILRQAGVLGVEMAPSFRRLQLEKVGGRPGTASSRAA